MHTPPTWHLELTQASLGLMSMVGKKSFRALYPRYLRRQGGVGHSRQQIQVTSNCRAVLCLDSCCSVNYVRSMQSVECCRSQGEPTSRVPATHLDTFPNPSKYLRAFWTRRPVWQAIQVKDKGVSNSQKLVQLVLWQEGG
jgi:hypothetical protein